MVEATLAVLAVEVVAVGVDSVVAVEVVVTEEVVVSAVVVAEIVAEVAEEVVVEVINRTVKSRSVSNDFEMFDALMQVLVAEMAIGHALTLHARIPISPGELSAIDVDLLNQKALAVVVVWAEEALGVATVVVLVAEVVEVEEVLEVIFVDPTDWLSLKKLSTI